MAQEQRRDRNASGVQPQKRRTLSRSDRNSATAEGSVRRNKAKVSVLLPQQLEVKPIPLPLVGGYYAMARDLLKSSYEYDPYLSVEECDAHMRELLGAGYALLWVIEHSYELVAAFVSMQYMYGNKRIMQLRCGASTDMDSMMDVVMSHIKDFAKMEACDFVELCGRDGWSKVLTPQGFKKTQIVMSLEVN